MRSAPKRNRVFRRFVAGCFVALFCTLFAVPALAIDEHPDTGEMIYYLYNFDYDTELCHSEFTDESGEDVRIYPASLVKLMSGLVAAEALRDQMDDSVTVNATMMNGVAGNNMALKVGETVKIRDMIYGLLTNCANDAAQVLAVTVSGSVEAFVTRMNDRARELGMYHTNFTNPTGMHDDKMYTTLRDLAVLCKAAYRNETVLAATSEVKFVMERTNKSEYRNLYNRNYLISTFHNSSGTDYRYAGVQGLNAGYTPQDGYCVATTVTRNKLTYLCIVLRGSEDEKGTVSSYVLCRNLLDWAFRSYDRINVLSDGTLVGELPVTLSLAVDSVKLCPHLPDGSIICYLPADVDVESEISYSWYTYEKELQAPVAKNTKVGAITVLWNGEQLASADLVTMNDVERSETLYLLERIKQFTDTRFFWAAILSAVVLSLLYIVISAARGDAGGDRIRDGVAVSLPVGPGRSGRSAQRTKPPRKTSPDVRVTVRPGGLSGGGKRAGDRPVRERSVNRATDVSEGRPRSADDRYGRGQASGRPGAGQSAYGYGANPSGGRKAVRCESVEENRSAGTRRWDETRPGATRTAGYGGSATAPSGQKDNRRLSGVSGAARRPGDLHRGSGANGDTRSARQAPSSDWDSDDYFSIGKRKK